MAEQKAMVTRWAGSGAANEADIRRLLVEEGLQAYRWGNGPDDVYSAHTHPFNKVIYVVEGAIVFTLPETNTDLELFAGDRLDLPRGTWHSAVVGRQGVICLEAHH